MNSVSMRGKGEEEGKEEREREKREKGRGGVVYLYKCIHSKTSKEQWPARAKLDWDLVLGLES